VRPATSDLVIACRHGKRYFDLDSCREPFQGVNAEKQAGGWNVTGKAKMAGADAMMRREADSHVPYGNPAGAPPLDWWLIPPGGFSGAHYAVWPAELLIRPIKLMAPPRVCTTCGRPSERIVGEASYVQSRNGAAPATMHMREGERRAEGVNAWATTGDQSVRRQADTLGWSDCGCPGGEQRWRPGHVLDPFGGSGTTGVVATGHGHDCTLIDIDARNADLAVERLGMFVTVEHHQPEEAA
jgi:hypothetical protein